MGSIDSGLRMLEAIKASKAGCRVKNCGLPAPRGRRFCDIHQRIWDEAERLALEQEYRREGLGEIREMQRHAMIKAHVCLIYAIATETHVKIGRTYDLPKRLAALQTASPVRLEVLACIAAPPHIERDIHSRLFEHRTSGEWFLRNGEVTRIVELMGMDDLPALIAEINA